ncbi:MAG TPA: cupin domain-containing protein [Candidatus Acidoferrales bacterium]|jgi:1,2-dihydroxy-3-keto-5-methylthiopentene dioxygenase|nr:cupin domain-containing protein [Candidatus Acidoferrales bacterium]
MATLRIPDEKRALTEPGEVREYLAGLGIDFERWEPAHAVAADASAEEILSAYSADIERLKAQGGYVTADVIDVKPETPGLEAMLNKFNSEHWHDEDEVRFIIEGRGIFHIHPRQGPIVAIEVQAGDLLRVPRGTWHWFDLCPERRIRAIRLFQNQSGWTPHYTESGVDRSYEPVCLGPAYLPPKAAAS